MAMLCICACLLGLTGCASYNPGFGFNAPGNITGTRGMIEHEIQYDENGVVMYEIKTARFEVQGDNIIEGLEVKGDMSTGTVAIGADYWESSKVGIVKASGEREAGNTQALGGAIGNIVSGIVNPASGVVGGLLDSSSPPSLISPDLIPDLIDGDSSSESPD